MEFKIHSSHPKKPFLHLSIDQYRPLKMECDPYYPDKYLASRMVPPGPLSFYYSQDDKEQKTFIDPSISSIENCEKGVK